MNKREHGSARTIAASALLALALGCTEQNQAVTDPGRINAASVAGTIKVSPLTASIAVGQTIRFTATKDSAGLTVPVRVTWLVKDAAIAKVDTSGLVTGLSAGSTLVGAKTTDGITAATLTVTAPTGGSTSRSLLLTLATYLGGSGADMARDVATDAQGNVYLGGSTASPNFPVTLNAFDRTFNSGGTPYHDAFLMKVSPTGQRLWSTFLGGPGFDRIYALEVDAQGFVYVAGRAGAGFPVTTGAFQRIFVGGPAGSTYGEQDGFVCKFRGDGTRVWCSYFGDTGPLAIRDIAVDAQGNVYVGSATAHRTFPATWFATAFQKSVRGGHDLVIAKISSDGARVLWATYLGGSRDEVTTPTIRVDAAQNVYVFSGTASGDIPKPGGFDATLGGPSDGYVAKIASDGTRLIWGTYLGGSGRELNETHSMALDPATGDVIIAAGTTSSDFPTTAGALQPRFGGLANDAATGLGSNYPGDAFVARIAANGTRLVASTYLGGADGDGAEGVWVDGSGAIYVSGTTYSTDFVVTATSSRTIGRADVFVEKLVGNLTGRIYAARLGGGSQDVGRACYVDGNGIVYAVGEVGSTDVRTLNAFQPQYGGALDGFLFKFVPN